MDAKTLKALKGSIKKWKDIEEGEGVDGGWTNCPLCDLYFSALDRKGSCKKCPVANAVGEINCSDTPYEQWLKHQNRKHDEPGDLIVRCRHCKKLARKEREFLESLLPEK